VNILDIACGIGWGSYLLAQNSKNKVYGIDISQNAIDVAKTNFSKDNLEYNIYNGAKLPFNNNTFDLIVSFETLEHVENPISFLDELHRVSKGNCMLLLSTPNSACTKKKYSDKPQNPFHFQEYGKSEIENMLKGKWTIENYLGQHPISKNNIKEINTYRIFIENYWRHQKLKNKNGIWEIFARLLARFTLLKDPSIDGDCTPIYIDDKFEPVCHFFICRSI